MRHRVSHQLALLNELGHHLVAQAALVPVTGPGQVGDRQLQVMDPGDNGSVRHVHDPSQCSNHASIAVRLHYMTENVNPPSGPGSAARGGASHGTASPGEASPGLASPGPELSPLRQAQIRQTEDRIIAAATELFLADG